MRYISDLTALVMKNRKELSFLLFFGVITGLAVGLIGSLFRLSIERLEKYKFIWFDHIHNLHTRVAASALFTCVALLLAVWLVRRFAPEAGGSGVQEIEGILAEKRPLRWKRVLPVKFFGGILSLAGGMVLGREGPTIQIGGSIGKMIGDHFRLNDGQLHALIAAGTAAGLGTAFNAPLAGILFVIEEMRSQFRYNFLSMQCVIIACVCSDIVLRALLGQHSAITMPEFTVPHLKALWCFVVFGALFGAMGLVFNRFLVEFLDLFTWRSKPVYWLMVTVVGLTVGALVILDPNIIGGGYDVIPEALKYNIPVQSLLILSVFRLVATWVSYGTGAPGGIFAPMLALGTIFGMWYGHFCQAWFPTLITNPGVFAVAGMSALFAATVGAPMTGIVLVVEMTSNYALILPLILTCFSASLVSYMLGGQPIYETLLQRTLKLNPMKMN